MNSETDFLKLWDFIFVGLSSELQSMYDLSKSHLNSSDNVHPDAAVPKSPPLRDNAEMEIEHLRNNEVPDVENVMSVILPSPHQPVSPPTVFVCSPSRGDKSTPDTLDFGSHSVQGGTNNETESRQTTDFTPSAGHSGLGKETPATYSGERLGVENTGLSDIPELLNSAGVCISWNLGCQFSLLVYLYFHSDPH